MTYKVKLKGIEIELIKDIDGSFIIPYFIKNMTNTHTALKPANEPICVARKPLSEKTVVDNVIKWGVGGINVDGCRVGSETITQRQYDRTPEHSGQYGNHSERKSNGISTQTEGRFPANIIFECTCDEVKGEKAEVKKRNKLNNNNGNSLFNTNVIGSDNYDYNDIGDIHTDPNCPCYQLDEQSGNCGGQKTNSNKKDSMGWYSNKKSYETNQESMRGYGDKGGASRFFYVAKVSKKERNLGLDDFEDKTSQLNSGGIGRKISVEKRLDENGENAPTQKNHHPTLKPIKLMSYLIRLVTPENGICLDPFMGSGSTGIAAMLEGKRFVGMELDEEYFKIAEKRIESWEQYKKLLK